MSENFSRSTRLHKAAVSGRGGVVAAQNQRAADIGAGVLRQGGNAVDAAIATSFALGTLEPWMSGLGGGGIMVVYLAKERKVQVVDFTLVAPQGLDPATYALAKDGSASDLFGWPLVVEDRNVKGPHSIAVPGQVAGMELALKTFGSWSWSQVLAPAIEQADRGIMVDWFSTLKVAAAARDFAVQPTTRATYLPDGFPLTPDMNNRPQRIKLGNLPQTLRRLASAGARDYYEGDIAKALVKDLKAAGSTIGLEDLRRYRAGIVDPLTFDYGATTIHATPGLTAGPTLQQAMQRIKGRLGGKAPDGAAFLAIAEAIMAANADRFAAMGDSKATTCTSHLNVVDAAGNMVALTQTLLSLFGSRVMLPETGIMMNNGIMWFDPRPGRPNSVAAGKRPLCNMCPIVATRAGEGWFALGASGGRRILPAVLQLAAFIADYGMDLETAFHQPRIDVSGTEGITGDQGLAEAVVQYLGGRHKTVLAPRTADPLMFACPSAVLRDAASGLAQGIAEITAPWAGAAAA